MNIPQAEKPYKNQDIKIAMFIFFVCLVAAMVLSEREWLEQVIVTR